MSGSGTTSAQSQAQAMANLQAQDQAIQQAIFAQASHALHQIGSQTISGTVTNNNNVMAFPLQNAGFITGLIVQISGTITNTGAAGTANISPTVFGTSNLIASAQLKDYSSYDRILTDGIHLGIRSLLRNRRGFGTSLSPANAPGGLNANGSGWNLNFNAGVLAPQASGAVQQYFHVPVARGKHDLTGAMNGMVVQNNSILTITLPYNAVVQAGDAVYAVYSGNTGTLSDVTVRVFQAFWDNVPLDKNGLPIMPPISMSAVYEMKKSVTPMSSIVAGTPYSFLIPNFRNYHSLGLLVDQNGTLNYGTDITAIADQTANFYQAKNVPPGVKALEMHDLLDVEPPPGLYLWDYGYRPINTLTYGNQSIAVTFSELTAGGQVAMYTDDTGYASTIMQAGNLLPNG